MALDTIIKDGLVVDGTGQKAYRGSVGIKDGKIVATGKISDSAKKTINADGLAVAPGFWDTHTHYDAQLLWDPIASSSSWHGITSVIMGNCGFSIAPCQEKDQEWMVKTLARVEGMPVELLKKTLPWPWGSFKQYLDRLDGHIAVNAMGQVGHTAVRRYVMGEESSKRTAKPEEITKMRKVLDESYRGGGFGLSTSRSPTHWDGDGNPVPSRVAALDEYMTLCEEMQGTTIGFIEMAGGSDLSRATPEGLARLVELTKRSGRPVCWSSISQNFMDPQAYKQQLQLLKDMRKKGVPFFALGNTQPDHFEFKFDSTNVFDRWNTWQKFALEPVESKKRLMKDPAYRAKLREEMKVDTMPALPTNWGRIILVKSPTGKYKQYETKLVSDIAKAMGKDPLDCAFDIALDENLLSHFRLLDSRSPVQETMMEILAEDHIAAGFTDAGAHLITEVNTGFSTRLLGYWVRERKLISLETAVRKLAAVTPEESGIKDRGHIKEGEWADITMFDPTTVAATDRVFTNDLPGGLTRLVQYATGIEYMLVNGEVTMQGGKHTGALAGKTIRNTKVAAPANRN